MAKRFSPICFKSYKTDTKIEVIDSLGFGDLPLELGSHTSFTVYLDLHYVELETLQDTVPSDRVVTLQGGWGLFGRQSSGEILLRLTYRAYVEDEEDDILEREVEGDSSDDEALDYDPASGEGEVFLIMEWKESLLWMFWQLCLKNASNAVNTSLVPETNPGDSTDLALVWLAAITSIAVLIALNVGDSSFFNP
ncbi:hypothetical protein HPP92_002511 [Vanilla planifolia]|uniref:Uncharacterized protein n=1 Tax=Vanilla planifolia TaxID=51239 RepID=A0A835S026_VANPL|nr:hypothetical protein HPP92_002511 [Vanilla planifolia]